MYSFISKCSLNEDIFIKTIESLLCARHGARTWGYTALVELTVQLIEWLCFLVQVQVWTSAFSVQTTRSRESGQGLCFSIGHFSKYLKNCYYFWHWFVLILSKKDAPRMSICKLWWRSRSQQRLIGFFGNHKHRHSSSSSQHSTLTGGQITPGKKGTISLCRHAQTEDQIFDIKVSPTIDNNYEIKALARFCM